MQIKTRLCMSRDGYLTTPDGLPVQLADPDFSPAAYGFDEFQKTLDAVLMGRTTFEPALGAGRWPWPGLDCFVLGSHRPEGAPESVIVHGDPHELLSRVRAESRGGDVHLIGGLRTIETYRELGAIDELGVIVAPVEVGSGQPAPAWLRAEAVLMDRAV